MMLLFELTTLSCAPLVDTPERPPVMVMPVEACTVATLTADVDVSLACFPEMAVETLPIPATVTVELKTAAPSKCNSRVAKTSRPCISALHVTLAIDSCEVELIDAPAFAAIVVIMLVPLRYSGPARIMLDPITAEPLTSIDGALTAHENTALLAEIPSRLDATRVGQAQGGSRRLHPPASQLAQLQR